MNTLNGQDAALASDSAREVANGGMWLARTWHGEVYQGITVQALVLIAAMLVAAWIFSRLVQRALSHAFAHRKASDAGRQFVIKRLVHYLIMVAGVFIALNFVGLELTSLFAAGAVFAVVVGFALQNLSENFVSGVILMIERSITPGDVLEVEGRVVRVIKMGIRATVARTRDDEDLIIPNSLLVTSTVKNFTLSDSLYRLRAVVGVAYSSDLKLVRTVLEDVAKNFAGRHHSKAPRVHLTGFGSSAVNYELSIWIEDPWHARQALSDLNEAIWCALQTAGVTIAFPQLDLHLDAAVLETLRAGPREQA
jgi:small-conductance mechanosensitive channel